MYYKISKEAANDLETIWFYTLKKWSIEQADRYYQLLMDEIENLAKNPTIGKDYSEVRKGYFGSRVKSHFIFYKINKQKEKIEIIRILHQRMNIKIRLSE